ncbi:hypothetical protein WKH00_22880, partial [Pantoea agglomerans]|uniref:hypothetical protein n=1 Tax=Enterobacter agglomerans TaxID=549 RepID=UPI003C7EB712
MSLLRVGAVSQHLRGFTENLGAGFCDRRGVREVNQALPQPAGFAGRQVVKVNAWRSDGRIKEKEQRRDRAFGRACPDKLLLRVGAAYAGGFV